MRSLAHDAYVDAHPEHPEHRPRQVTRWTLLLGDHLPDHSFCGLPVSLAPERVLVRQVYRALSQRHGSEQARDGVRRMMRLDVLAYETRAIRDLRWGAT